MKIFDKWFCKHKWKSHNKERFELESFKRVHGGEVSLGSTIFTKEILICEHCGKIKTIKY